LAFLRKVWALLVFQYTTVLVLTSPFAFIYSFQEILHPLHTILEGIANAGGIAGTLVLGASKGTVYPFAQICLLSITFFVALNLGLTFATASWATEGFVALGQATTPPPVSPSFWPLLHFDLKWLNYPTAAGLCLILAGMWSMVLVEAGVDWRISVAIAAGAWAFVLTMLFSSYTVSHYVSPHEYILAALFILVPEALLCLAGQNRRP
jgi:hypothetical protein